VNQTSAPKSRKECRAKVLEIINRPPPENMEDSYMDLAEAFESAFQRGIKAKPGLTLPKFKKLSDCLGGIRPKGTTLICGPTGAGKTALLANLWVQFHEMGIPVWCAPVETGKEDFIDSLVSIFSGRNRVSMSAQDWHQVKAEWAHKFTDRKHTFSNNESRVNHIDFLAEIYYSYLTKGTKIAMADNWQFMLDVGKGDDIGENDKALHDVVVFFKHVPIHLFLVMHPKKTEDERVSSVYDLKGSSTSVQEAHSILLFNKLKDLKDSPLMTLPELCREITIGKSRYNGRAVGHTLIYHMDPVCELYKEYREKE
jgi:hypothetical protein